MPIFVYKCMACGTVDEVLLSRGVQILPCPHCGQMSIKQPTFPAMVKIKGEGGYPSRRKFVKGSAPYTSRDTKAWLDEKPKVE